MPATDVTVPNLMDMYAPSPFSFDSAKFSAGPSYSHLVGSGAGVPPIDPIYDETTSSPGGSAVEAAKGFGDTHKGLPAHHQPVFWSFAFMIAGTMLLTHAALVNVREG